MSLRLSLGELAERIGGRVVGDPGRVIAGVATLEHAEPEHLTFLTNPRYRRAAMATRAGAVLVAPGTDLPGKDRLEARHPYAALAQVLEIFHPPQKIRPGVSRDARLAADVRLGEEVEIGPFAVLEDGVVVGDRVRVGAGSFVGEGASIGDDSVLMPRVVLYPATRVGCRCIVHSGVVLGGDGFGFATVDGQHRKIPQVGRVIVEDDVEIGANTAVDRGTLEDTVIGRGTKIDDLVMIAHGVRIGPDGLFAGQAGIAGSTRLGARVVFAGQSGASGHLEIGDGVIVAAKTAVFDDVPAGSFVAGIPATDHRIWKRSQALARRLPDLRARVLDLESRLARIEADRAKEK